MSDSPSRSPGASASHPRAGRRREVIRSSPGERWILLREIPGHHAAGRITSAIAEPFAELKRSPDMVLLVANLLFLVAGMFIDVFSNILILVPILLGTVTASGIGLVHFGIVTSVNTDIGNITPPFGLNLFVASGTLDKPYMTVVRAVLPWLGLALLSLAIITYFPELSLWLPKQMYPGVR